MPLQAQQVVTLSCQIAKCPGFTSQGGQFLNATLQDLCQGYDLDAALGTNAFSFNSTAGQGSGPYTLPADYLRTQVKDGKDEFFYTINGVPYPLIQCTKAEYDWMVQTPGFQNFPYYYATDLSVSPPQLFVWPPASGAYPCIMRYYRLMPDIATPESSATVPWFLNTEILITSTAGRLMGITGDSRYEAYMSEDVEKHPTSWKAKLSTYLKNVEDREGAVHTVGRDRRRWGRSFDLLKNTKTIGWLLPFLALALVWFAEPMPAHANCTTPCTKAQIATDIATNWPDNTAGAITPALLRSTVLDLVNSYTDINGASSFTCSTHQFLVSIATLSSYSCAQPAIADISGFGTGVATALGVNVGSAGAPVLFNGALGTPSSGTLTSATGLPISTGVSGLGTGVATALSNNAGGVGGVVLINGTLGTPSSGNGSNISSLSASNVTSGNLPDAQMPNTAWTAFTPSFSCGTASITNNSSRSKTWGKVTHIEVDFTFTAIGTCTNAVTFNLPNTSASAGGMAGRELVSTGKGAVCGIGASGATTGVCTIADLSVFASTSHVIASGVYENQ